MYKENCYKIYVHISPNGKLYIGQTKTSLEIRAGKQGIKYKGCPYFYSAIQKYGWDNFKHIILIENLTLSEANIIEETLISKYNTTNSKNGYNLDFGGNNYKNRKSKKGMSRPDMWIEVYQYDLCGNFLKYYRNITEAVVENPKASGLRFGNSEIKYAGGYLWSTKYYNSLDKYNNPHNKMTYQYSLVGELINVYSSVKEASIETNTPSYLIGSCCNGRYKSANGFMWSYFLEKKDIYHDLTKEKEIIQFDNNNVFIRKYDSIKQAESITGISHGNINKCCKNQRKTAGGYIWKYA